MVDSIRPFSDLDQHQAVITPERLYIRLPSAADPQLRKVRLALSFFPGEQGVVLFFEDTKKRLGGKCHIQPALLADLEERLGKGNVVVK